MWSFLYTAAAIGALTLQTIALNAFGRNHPQNRQNYFLFQFIQFLLVSVFVALPGIAAPAPQTLYMGLACGVLFILFMYSFSRAMALGPLSITSLINSFAIVIPVLVGLFFWCELVLWWQWLGLALLFVSFYLGSAPKPGGERRASLRWLAHCLIAFACNGGLATISKAHQLALPGQQRQEFLFYTSLTACLLCVVGMLAGRARRQGSWPRLSWGAVGLAALTAAGTALGNYMILTLSSFLPSVLIFPVVSGTMVMLTSAISYVFLKERPTGRGISSLCLGLLSIVMLSLR